MSAINRLFAQGQRAIELSGHRDCLTVTKGTSTGLVLTGVLDVEPVLDPDMPLGADPRMQTVFRVLSQFPRIALNDLLTDGVTTWKAIKCEANAVTVTVDYWLEQQL